MNERIRELALEAFQPINDIASEGIADRHTFNQAWFQLYNQKFAELIVKECCSIIETDLETNQIKAETDNEGRIWVNAQLTFSEVIKLHFGVKE